MIATALALAGHVLGTRHGPALVSAATIALLLASLGKNYLICRSGVLRIDDEWLQFIPLILIAASGPIVYGLPRPNRNKAHLAAVITATAVQLSLLLRTI